MNSPSTSQRPFRYTTRMKQRVTWLACICFAHMLALGQPDPGAVEKARLENAQLETRTFRVSQNFLFGYSSSPAGVSIDPLGFTAPEPRSASQRVSSLAQFSQLHPPKDILSAAGIPFPPGSSCLYDPATCTLRVCNTLANLALVAPAIEAANPQPTASPMVAYLVQAPGPLLRLLADNAKGNADQSDALNRLLTAAENGADSVQLLHTAFLQTKAGHYSTFETSVEHVYTLNLSFDKGGRTSVDSDMRELGFKIDVDSYSQPRITSALTLLWGKPRSEILTEPVSGGPAKMPVPEFQTVAVASPLTWNPGRTRLLSVWPAKGDPSLRGRDISQVLFVTPQTFTLPPPPIISVLPPLPAEADADTLTEHTFELPSEFIPGADTLLRRSGIKLPPGSAVREVDGGHLSVKTTWEMMPVVEAWVRLAHHTYPRSLNFTLEVVRAPAPSIQPLLSDAASRADHRPLLNELRNEIASGQAQRISLSCLDTKSRERAVLQSHLDRHFISELTWQTGQQPAVSTDRSAIGLNFEIDATLTALGQAVELDFVLERHFAPPSVRHEELSDPASRQTFVMPRDSPHIARVRSSTTMMDGSTRLIGVWQPVGDDGLPTDNELELAFLTCHVVRHVPAVPPHDSKSAAAAVKSAASPAPFLTRSFKIPQSFGDYYTVGIPLQTPLLDYLRFNGITFPKGAGVIPRGNVAGHLIITNTPENLDHLQDLIDALVRRQRSDINLLMHMVEAPGDDVRDLVARWSGSSDHTPALKHLQTLVDQQKARYLTSLHLTTQNGASAVTKEAKEFQSFAGMTINGDGVAEIQRRTIPSGVSFEGKPKLSIDSSTLDVHCRITHHPSPPVLRTENLAPAGSPPLEIPLTDFHVDSYEGSITLLANTARILTVWKPTGPEFKGKHLLHIAILEASVVNVEQQ